MNASEKPFNCIAVDMGAGSIRVMLSTVNGNSISLEEVHRFPNEIKVLDGRDRWDMDYIVREIKAGIHEAVSVSDGPPQSVGVDSWGADFVLLDDHGELVETPVAYRDKRTVGMQELWSSSMSRQETFSRTGINFYLFNTLFQLLSLKGKRSIRNTSAILFIPCYINYLLSGKKVNELTIASTSQILGVDGDQWDGKILGKLDLEVEKLGTVIPPGTRLGPVSFPDIKEKQMECVAVCGHDTACMVAALPVENPNFAYISAGTWCIVGIESDQPLTSEEALQLGITNERGYGGTYRCLKNIVGLWLLQGLKKNLSAEISFAQMEEMVHGDEESSLVIDPDDPVFYNPENMKLAFDRYFEKSGQPLPERFSDYIRCAYDSLCFSFRYHIEQIEKLSKRSMEVLHVVGGGSQSEYLCRRIASICRREVISGPVEGSAMGNVLIQGIAMGKIADLQEGRRLLMQSCPVNRYLPGVQLPHSEERYRKYLTLKT
jgi:rhamnulokinase